MSKHSKKIFRVISSLIEPGMSSNKNTDIRNTQKLVRLNLKSLKIS